MFLSCTYVILHESFEAVVDTVDVVSFRHSHAGEATHGCVHATCRRPNVHHHQRIVFLQHSSQLRKLSFELVSKEVFDETMRECTGILGQPAITLCTRSE